MQPVKHKPRRTRGVAMLAALLLLVVASGIITLMFTSTLSEIRQSGDSAAIVRSLSLARGGANLGARLLNDGVRDELQLLVLANADTGKRFPFGDAPNITDPAPTPETVIQDLAGVTASLQQRIDSLVCGEAATPKPAHELRLWIYVSDTACAGLPSEESLSGSVDLPAARYVTRRTYSVPFVLVSRATVGDYEREIVSQGEYQFVVGGGKFSQYALFTDEHLDPRGERVWFTDKTLFDGRVHTNTTFNFAFDPWFGGEVTSAGCTATARAPHPTMPGKQVNVCTAEQPGASFISEGANSFKDLADFNSLTSPSVNTDKPAFAGGVDWQASYIALPDDALGQEKAAQTKGLVIDKGADLYSLTLFAGDANATPLTSDGNGGWTSAASHQYVRACESVTVCDLYRYGPDQVLYREDADGAWVDPVTDFNGVIYVRGGVERFTGPPRTGAPPLAAPALASFAALTVVPEKDVVITGDLSYEEPPCATTVERVNGAVVPATCADLNVKNILGVFAPNENILLGNQNTDGSRNAPDDVVLHGSFMAAKGVFAAQNYNVGGTRGAINLLGGIIEQRYGAVGTFGGKVQKNGYHRSFTFDPRMGLDYAPPFFPGTQPNIVQSVFVYSYGQREQTF